MHPTFFLLVRWLNHKHVPPFHAQCRSETSKARRNRNDGLVRGMSAQWLVLTSYVSASRVFLKRKIPISTDTGSGFASFFFFPSQALFKNLRTHKIHMGGISSNTAGFHSCFMSTAHLNTLRDTSPHLETLKKNIINRSPKYDSFFIFN